MYIALSRCADSRRRIVEICGRPFNPAILRRLCGRFFFSYIISDFFIIQTDITYHLCTMLVFFLNIKNSDLRLHNYK